MSTGLCVETNALSIANAIQLRGAHLRSEILSVLRREYDARFSDGDFEEGVAYLLEKGWISVTGESEPSVSVVPPPDQTIGYIIQRAGDVKLERRVVALPRS